MQPVTPLDGFAARYRVSYAQGASLAEGVPVVIPRTAFGAGLIREEAGSYTMAFLIAGLFGVLAAMGLAISARPSKIAIQTA